MSYPEDSFFDAVAVLATHGPIKQRLIRAYEDHLEEIDDGAVPLTVRESVAGLRRLMHGVAPANGEGRVCASVRKMSKVEADRCAAQIVEICHDVSRFGSDAEVPMPEAADEPQALPPFLVKSV